MRYTECGKLHCNVILYHDTTAQRELTAVGKGVNPPVVNKVFKMTSQITFGADHGAMTYDITM